MDALLDRIYEAAAIPENWSGLLHDLSRLAGARGAVMLINNPSSSQWIASPSTFRLTAAAWLKQRRADKFEAAGYLGMTLTTLEDTYGHHHPDHQPSVAAAFSKKRPKVAF